MTDSAFRFLATCAAVAPVALLLMYAVARDGGRSSTGLIGLALSFGAIAGVPAIAFSMSLNASGIFDGASNISMSLTRAFLFAAVPEEFAKFLMLVFIVARHEDCARPTDILTGSIAIALGFAALESSFYIVESDDWIRAAILRAMSATPGHFFDGVLLGVFVSGLVNLGTRWKNYLTGLTVVILAHAFYDAPLLSFESSPLEGRIVAVTVFTVTSIITSSFALRYLRLLSPSEGVTSNGRWLLRILMAHQTWRVIGAALIVLSCAVVVVGVIGLSNKNYERAVFVPFVIVPIAVGWSMTRFGQELAWRRKFLSIRFQQ